MRYRLKNFIDPNQSNILIHAGDCTNVGKENEVIEFIQWFQNIEGFDDKIFIAGNHDFAFEQKPSWLSHYINDENLSQSNCVYLEDNEYVINSPEFSRPIKIYGSPWQPEFYNWAFNLPRFSEELKLKWGRVPLDTDILITHGPPHGIRDFTPFGLQVGCELLRIKIFEINPLIHVFGHIHHAYGGAQINDTLFVNASICDERYRPINKPIVVELKEYAGEVVATYID